eukprot:scaffold28078_cov57-Phaeocystis_antarctica.AAC.6
MVVCGLGRAFLCLSVCLSALRPCGASAASTEVVLTRLLSPLSCRVPVARVLKGSPSAAAGSNSGASAAAAAVVVSAVVVSAVASAASTSAASASRTRGAAGSCRLIRVASSQLPSGTMRSTEYERLAAGHRCGELIPSLARQPRHLVRGRGWDWDEARVLGLGAVFSDPYCDPYPNPNHNHNHNPNPSQAQRSAYRPASVGRVGGVEQLDAARRVAKLLRRDDGEDAPHAPQRRQRGQRAAHAVPLGQPTALAAAPASKTSTVWPGRQRGPSGGRLASVAEACCGTEACSGAERKLAEGCASLVLTCSGTVP